MKDAERAHRCSKRLFAIEEANPGDTACSGSQGYCGRFRRDAAERDERKGFHSIGRRSQLAQAEGLPQGAL